MVINCEINTGSWYEIDCGNAKLYDCIFTTVLTVVNDFTNVI